MGSPFDTSLQNTIHQNLTQTLQNSPRNNLSEIFGKTQNPQRTKTNSPSPIPSFTNQLTNNNPPPLTRSSIFATDWSKTSVDTNAGLGFFGLSGATNFESLENSRNNSLDHENNEGEEKREEGQEKTQSTTKPRSSTMPNGNWD